MPLQARLQRNHILEDAEEMRFVFLEDLLFAFMPQLESSFWRKVVPIWIKKSAASAWFGVSLMFSQDILVVKEYKDRGHCAGDRR